MNSALANNQPKKIVIFCGGTGASSLTRGLSSALPESELISWINLCDAGKSTGVVAETMETLGVSDARKNLSLHYDIVHGDHRSRDLVEFLEGRFDLGATTAEAKDFVIQKLNLWQLQHFIPQAELFFSKVSDYANFCDFNIANIIMGALFYEIGIEATIEKIKNLLSIPTCNIIVPWHNYNRLQAVTQSGLLLEDEGKIVDWNNPRDRIQEVFFVNPENNSRYFEYELYSKEYLSILDDADLIILSSGTQWSSLIPSYMNRHVKACLERNAHKVILCINNIQDKDMQGMTANEVLAVLRNYLDISNFKILYNLDAAPGMKVNSDYGFSMGNDSKGRSDPDKFAYAILRTHSTDTTKKFDVIILASGKQTRYKSSTPKALAAYAGTTVLEHNIKQLTSISRIRNINLVVRPEKAEWFYGISGINLYTTDRSNGTGDSLLASLEAIPDLLPDVILIWSDIILDKENIVTALIDYDPNYLNIPAVEEDSPYTGFVESNGVVTEVLFSSKGDDTSKAKWHDLSFFFWNTSVITPICYQMQANLVDAEFDFLDIPNKYESIARIIPVNGAVPLGYNTVEKHKKIIDMLGVP